MNARADIAAIVRHCDTGFLDTRYDKDAEPGDIADQLYTAVRVEVLREAKIEVVAWLVKKDREDTPVGRLASKVDRGAIRIFLGTGHYRDAMDTHRAQVLAEAADYVEQRRLARADLVTDFDRGRRAAEGCVVEELRELAGKKATATAATATPDFFQAGRTYIRRHRDGSTCRYICEHTTVDPKDGCREAWGWLHRTDGTRRMQRMWDDDYPTWTETGEGRG